MPDLSRKERQQAIDRLTVWHNNESVHLSPTQMNNYERTWSNDSGRRARGLQPVRKRWLDNMIIALMWLGGVLTILMIGLVGAMVLGL